MSQTKPSVAGGEHAFQNYLVSRTYMKTIAVIGLVFSLAACGSGTHEGPAAKRIPEGTVSRDFTDTIAGIDNNQNGVRDDIEEFINKSYPDPKQRAAMMQYAASEQNALLDSSTKQAAFIAAQRVYRSLDCVILVLGRKDFAKEADEILAMMLNTRSRAKAYAAARSASAGQVYETGARNPCDSQ